jgi:hypothetical protein
MCSNPFDVCSHSLDYFFKTFFHVITFSPKEFFFGSCFLNLTFVVLSCFYNCLQFIMDRIIFCIKDNHHSHQNIVCVFVNKI